MINAEFEVWNARLEAVKSIHGLTWSLALETLPESMYCPGMANNAMGLDDRDGTLVICLMTQTWANQAKDERVDKETAALVDALEERVHALNAYDPFLYLNYAAPWHQPIASYDNASVRHLQDLRAQVDPSGVFTNLVSGGYKVPHKKQGRNSVRMCNLFQVFRTSQCIVNCAALFNNIRRGNTYYQGKVNCQGCLGSLFVGLTLRDQYSL
jgi:hypothetical protein